MRTSLHRGVVGSFGLLVAALAIAAGSGDADQGRFLARAVFVPPAAAEPFAADRVLMKFERELEPELIDAIVGPLGAKWQRSGVGRAFEVVAVPNGRVVEYVDVLARLPGVVYAEPDYAAWMTGVPNDPLYKPYQWNFFDQGELSNGVASNFGIQAESAWNTANGTGVTVAIVDTGVAYENYGSYVQAPDLAGATFVSPWDFVNNDAHANDDNSHGTHVCGTIRQSTNNALGVAGVAHGCSIMPVKVLDAAGSGYHSWIADGIRWAADHGAFVINMSLGSGSGSSTLQSAVDYAWTTKGVVLCAATGNSGAGSISYPARYANCIAVGATRFDGRRCTYSQWGSGMDVMAPGGDTRVDQNGDGYGDGILQQTFSGSPSSFAYYFFQGTSMATPHVTAVAALVKSNKPGYTNSQVRSAIESTTKDLDKRGYDTKTGYGLVDAAKALTW